MSNAPTAAEYVRGMQAIESRITDDHIQLFRLHYIAPDRTATAKQLGEWASPPKAHGVVNSLYGKLGHHFCDALEIVPDLRPTDTYRWWSVWSIGWSTPGGFVWQMLPQVAEALEQLGWVEPVPFTLPGGVEPESFTEGAVIQRWVGDYDRNSVARDECKKLHGTACVICGFDFGKRYGSEFAGFIHVHHLVPLSKVGKKYKVDPKTDLVPLCPNCHAVIHHGGQLRTPDDVRKLLMKSAKSEDL